MIRFSWSFRETSSLSKRPLNCQWNFKIEGCVFNKEEWMENSTKREDVLRLQRATPSILKRKLQAIRKVGLKKSYILFNPAAYHHTQLLYKVNCRIICFLTSRTKYISGARTIIQRRFPPFWWRLLLGRDRLYFVVLFKETV